MTRFRAAWAELSWLFWYTYGCVVFDQIERSRKVRGRKRNRVSSSS